MKMSFVIRGFAILLAATCVAAHSHDHTDTHAAHKPEAKLTKFTNDHEYCVEQRRTDFAVCKKETSRTRQISCEKVHQVLCRDKNALLRLTCLQAAISMCLYRGNWGTPEFETCKKDYDAECPRNNLPAPLKCAAILGDYYAICKPSRKAPILTPCGEYVSEVCPSTWKAPKLPCSVRCASWCKHHGSTAPGGVEKCVEDCATTCLPKPWE